MKLRALFKRGRRFLIKVVAEFLGQARKFLSETFF
jgi:hypothetical protein